MKLKPLGDRIVVKAAPHEEKTKGGLVLPDTVKEKPIEGIVVAVGAGKINDDGKRQPMDLKEGDNIIYSKYSGTEVKLDGEDLLVLSERDVLAVVEK
ncbi:MAG: co-chaperone GroES [Synergistaceae bacterium]|jgi:chaperonin GroES|nr:co-chaperone GroES [Synergistaceae bacterium]